jgi:hypothetical protein
MIPSKRRKRVEAATTLKVVMMNSIKKIGPRNKSQK